jgi:hypothetical protein
MTTWTTISNAAVAVGGIPSSSTVTALRDNPSAIAEAASGAPVMVSGWHPIDKVTIGDGKTGLIYDGAVNGTVANVTTAPFEDGWEYRVVCQGLVSSGTGGLLVSVLWEGETVYYPIFSGGNASTPASCEAEFSTARIAKNWHGGFLITTRGSSLSDSSRWAAYNATAKKLSRFRILFSTNNITGGKVYLFRRREYASLP